MICMIRILKTPDFEKWFKQLRNKEQLQVDSRLEMVKHGHFGDAKSLGDGLAELRWKSGRRIYFFKSSKSTIVILLGGLKNAQEKDIKKARILLRRHGN
ncbi:Uncharacterized protein HI_1419 [Chlamydiales bacterium SCGC AG-110-M15]|nr:Uncharacterized protein HI_1419 [Chlamydiales bacterium SCGC AG-110-M15]